MTHEFKKIVLAYQASVRENRTAVLATVVALEGSSYRRPGVRMLITEDQKMIGAVSGGCVEKEVLRQAEAVFNTGLPKIMTYDGRYRLGCEGILYILIEPFNPSDSFLEAFWKSVRDRSSFQIRSHYSRQVASSDNYGSVLEIGTQEYPCRQAFSVKGKEAVFMERMKPCSRLLIIGAEHDAVQLCSFAALMGWEVSVVANPAEEKTVADFPGAQELLCVMPEAFDASGIDNQTAIILMTHSFVKDLQFLISLKDSNPFYLGLLGPASRRERLLNEFLERCPEVSEALFERLHGPAGLNIGAETPQEIAIAVLSEVLSVMRGQEPIPLRDKKGTIHN
jgi:xanthine/CO dehydrogenase XdhC/CoxF family maturation factor